MRDDPDADLSLVAALGARIVHDLTGPVSAIVNGVEIAQEGGVDLPEAMALIAGSGETAAARLRFFRVAFGPRVASAAMADLAPVAAAYFAASRARLAWPSVAADPPGGPRLAALLLLLADEAVPMGGEVTLAATGDRLSVAARGRNGGLRPETAAALEGTWTDGSSRSAPAYLAYRVARAEGISVVATRLSDGVEVVARIG